MMQEAPRAGSDVGERGAERRVALVCLLERLQLGFGQLEVENVRVLDEVLVPLAFGSGTTPSWGFQRRRTCAGVFRCAATIAVNVESRSRAVRVSGL